MKGTTGLAGLVVTALVSALVAFAVAALLGPTPVPAPSSSPGAPSEATILRLEREVAELRARLDEGRSAVARPSRNSAPGSAGPAAPPGSPSADGTTPPGETGPEEDEDGPLPSGRRELLALIDTRIDEKGVGGPARTPPEPKPRLTIEEAGVDMGLSAFEIDAVKRAFQESETEMITAVMGTADLDAIKEEVRAAKDDPDKKAALVQKAVGNVIRNLGRVATVEDRRDRELRRILSEEQVKRLKGYNLRPTLADGELEDVLKGAFGGR